MKCLFVACVCVCVCVSCRAVLMFKGSFKRLIGINKDEPLA